MNQEKNLFLEPIKKVLLKDTLEINTKLEILEYLKKTGYEFLDDIIDDLLNHKDIFNEDCIYGIDEEKLDEWISKEKKTLRISHDTKIIQNSYNYISKYDRVVIPGSVELIDRSFNFSKMVEIEFLEPKNDKEKGLLKIDNSFNNTKLEKLKLPKSLKEIENSFNMSNIKEIDFNEKLNYLKNSFNNIPVISINLPKKLKTINRCFNDSLSLVKLKLNNKLERIIESFNKSEIKELTIPKTTKEISFSFNSNNNLENIELEEGLEKLYASFDSCKIKKVEIPSTVEDLFYVFNYCEELKDIKLNNGVKDIIESFEGSKIKKIFFPESVERIDESFQYCKELEEISLNKNLRIINTAFNDCNLQKVIIPKEIKVIDNSFKDNPNLEDVNKEVKNYLLVSAYIRKYYGDLVKTDYKDLMISDDKSSFKGTRLYSLIEEEVNKFEKLNVLWNKSLKVYKINKRINI